ncbi:MAG: hypothetical protein IPI93_12515 [Sphingobacteriaceae bacterium]|nr:hypothetical protein [Sphingobacteriaceae bacterium]
MHRSFICLFTKQLPIEKWIELCDLLSSSTTIYILGSANDSDLAKKII